MKKQRNNHARSKRKRMLLHVKNKMRWVLDYRREKLAKINRPKGYTLKGKKAKEVAIKIALGGLAYRSRPPKEYGQSLQFNRKQKWSK